MNNVRKASVAGALAALAVFAPQPADASPGQAIGVTGGGSTIAGGYYLSVNAHLTPSGAFGTWDSWFYKGTIDQIMPPSGDRDYFCISGPISTGTGERMNIYIRNSGNGRTSFDQWQMAAGTAANCQAFPDQLAPWLTLDSGDFKVTGSGRP